MYDNFILRKTRKGSIAGYTWPVEEPKMVACIIHGIGEYAGRYERIAKAFNEKNIAVLSMDLRGHGLSMGRRGHCAPRSAVFDDITELIVYSWRMYPNVPILMYGHSMGGNILLDYMYRGELNNAPCGYIVSAPWLRLVRETPKALVGFVQGVSKIAPSATIGAGIEEDLLGNPESVGDYAQYPLVHGKISLATVLDGIKIGEAIASGKMEDNGKASEIPLLLMHGDMDAICDVNGSRDLAERLTAEGRPGFTYKEWPGLYHEIHNGGPESLGDEVIDYAVDWAEGLL